MIDIDECDMLIIIINIMMKLKALIKYSFNYIVLTNKRSFNKQMNICLNLFFKSKF